MPHETGFFYLLRSFAPKPVDVSLTAQQVAQTIVMGERTVVQSLHLNQAFYLASGRLSAWF